MRPLLSRLPSAALVALLAASCAAPPVAPPPRPPPAVVARPAASAAVKPAPPPLPPPLPPDPAIVSVTAARVPARFALDGDLAEWGSLLPPIPPPPAQPLARSSLAEPPPDEAPPAPNPRDAASHLAIAVSHDGALIAADLGGPARDGIWLGIRAEAAAVPPIGVWQNGGGVAEMDCDVNVATGEALSPAAIAACRALYQGYAELVAAHAARFVRLFRVDREGVRAAQADGTLAPIDGAKAVFKAAPNGATVEIALPLKALPRLAEAPLGALALVARAAIRSKPLVLSPAPWVWLQLVDPVGFEPGAEIRARAFEAISSSMLFVPTGLSYHPSDPLHVEIYSYDRGIYEATHIAPSEHALYTRKATLGDVEVGLVSAYNEWIAILKKGKLVDLVGLSGTLMSIVERGGALHVLTCSRYTSTDIWAEQAQWSVLIIGADGTYDETPLQPEGGSRPWNEVAEFHDEKLTSFGLRGWSIFNDSGKEKGLELSWRWDASKKTYVARRRPIPIHKSKKKP